MPPADVLAAELEQRIEEKVRETLTERILREANLDGQVKAAIDKIEKPTTAVGLRAAAHSRSPQLLSAWSYRDGLSLCLTSKEETEITTIIQRRPQHPRRIGRDQSEQLVAIRRN